MKWISVKDRLPEDRSRCKVKNRWDKIFIGMFREIYEFDGRKGPPDEDFFVDISNWSDCFEIKDVTHWMPLPQLPKE